MADIVGSLIGGIGGIGGSTIGAAIVKLRLDSDDYNRQMDAAHAKTGQFAGLAKASFVALGAAAVAGLGVAIKLGSDLNEQINKTREVFGGAAKQVLDFSKTTASSLGLAQVEALEAAGNFGQLFDAAGLSSQAAADMSKKMVTLSADLGSFNNIPVAEALEKIRSGLAGEAEPLRQVGVFLSEARVQQEAYTSGIAKAGEELTDAQKIQARYNIILQDTAKASGDFSRTLGESVPNQMKVLKAELTDVASGLGRSLLPLVLDVVKAFHVLVPLLGFAADHLDLIVIALAGFAAYKWLPGFLDATAAATVRLVAALGGSLTAQGSVSAAFATAAGAAGGFVTAMAAVPFVAFQVAEAIDPVEQEMETLNERMKNFGVVRGPAMAEAAERVAAKTEEMKAKAALASQGILDFGGRTAETTQNVKELNEETQNFAHMTTKELQKWSTSTKQSFKAFIFDLNSVSDTTKTTRKDVREAFNAMEDHAIQLSRAMNRLKDEDWINDRFLKFLSDQGPSFLIGFSKLNEEQQRKMQEKWRESGDVFRSDINEPFQIMIGRLNWLDKHETRHKVTIEYDYVGFDPSKPGMAAGQTGGAQSGQQR